MNRYINFNPISRFVEVQWWSKNFAYVCMINIFNNYEHYSIADDWFRRYSVGLEPARYGVPMVVENYR